MRCKFPDNEETDCHEKCAALFDNRCWATDCNGLSGIGAAGLSRCADRALRLLRRVVVGGVVTDLRPREGCAYAHRRLVRIWGPARQSNEYPRRPATPSSALRVRWPLPHRIRGRKWGTQGFRTGRGAPACAAAGPWGEVAPATGQTSCPSPTANLTGVQEGLSPCGMLSPVGMHNIELPFPPTD
jgi:hypothetical protein